MKNAKKDEPEFIPELTPELEAMLAESEAQIDRGEYFEIGPEVEDIVGELRRLMAAREK